MNDDDDDNKVEMNFKKIFDETDPGVSILV